MSLSIGSIQDPGDQARKAWQELLSEWHAGESESGTHSAAGWALQSWELSLPSIEMENEWREESNWYVTNMGLTLIRIPAGQVARPADRGA